jgi:polyisoprenyl-phosphate glycosyltransferase
MRCSRCRADNSAGMKFCGQCGAPLGSACPSCGAANPSDNRFCGQCGAALDRLGLQEFAAPEPYLPRPRDTEARNAKDTLITSSLSTIDPQVPDLSVVVPCFNEEAGLRELCRRVTAICQQMCDYELILVNDGSRDGTWNLMRQLADEDPHIAVINLSRNHGHQLALTAGLTFARGRRVLIIDADLQDPPELLPEMMRLMDEGADVVYGQRRRREGETLFKTLTAKLFYQLMGHLTDVDIPADAGDFRLMTRRSLDILNSMPEQSRFVRGMVSWIGLKQIPLLYDRDPRFAGETKYPVLKMMRFAVDAITGFSIVPLRVASVLGMVMGVISLLMLSYTLGSWALGRIVEGWTSLSTIVLIVSSVQLLVLGILGEYLGRLYMQSKERPLFIIDTVYTSALAVN